MANENGNGKTLKLIAQGIGILLLTGGFISSLAISKYKADEALTIAKENQEKLIVLERIDERLNNIEKAIERIENKK
jgi:hypothetical protein